MDSIYWDALKDWFSNPSLVHFIVPNNVSSYENSDWVDRNMQLRPEVSEHRIWLWLGGGGHCVEIEEGDIIGIIDGMLFIKNSHNYSCMDELRYHGTDADGNPVVGLAISSHKIEASPTVPFHLPLHSPNEA